MLKKIKALLFENKTTRQTVAKNAFWLYVSNIGGRLIRATIIIYSARVLGASNWGIFSYAVSLIAFITIFTDFGINSLLVREASKSNIDSERHKIISTSFIFKLALVLVGILAVFAITPRIATMDIKPILTLVVFILIFDTVRDFGFSLIRASEKMEQETALYLLTNLAIVAFGLISLKMYGTVKAFTFSYAAGTAVGMIATLWVLRKDLRGLFSGFSPTRLKAILTSAWPFAISGLLSVLMLNTDIIIIGWLKGAESVGLYSAGQRIVQVLYLLPSIAYISLLPTFARLANKDNQKLRRILESAITLVFLFAIPASVGGFLLGKSIIPFIFGAGYSGASLAFRILILTLLVDFPVMILSSFIFSFDKQKNITIYSAIGGFSNVIFDLIFIPMFGIAGSSLATLLAQFLSMRYLWWVAKKTGYFEILPHLKRAVAATAVMALVCLILQSIGIHVLETIAVAGAVYVGLLFATKEPIIKELRLILRSAVSDERVADIPASL
jgi:O-antigen/teichoic acid export membrane protein